MKNLLRTLALASITALTLTGCVISQPEPEGASEPSPVEEVDAAVETPTEEAPEEAAEDEGPELTDRGFLPKSVGEVSGMTAEGEQVVEFTLTEINANYQCTEYASPSQNGSYVGLHFDVEVFPGFADANYGIETFSLSAYEFQGFDADGKRVNDVVGYGFSCAEMSDSLPYDIGESQSASGWLILDLPPETTVIAYVPPLSGSGWEWQLP